MFHIECKNALAPLLYRLLGGIYTQLQKTYVNLQKKICHYFLLQLAASFLEEPPGESFSKNIVSLSNIQEEKKCSGER